MAMSWWIWMLFGFVLLALEIATPGIFFLIFFGAGALVVGALVGIGLVANPWIEWTLFSVISVGLLALLRKPLRERMHVPRGQADPIAGEIAITMEAIAAGTVGKAELRGTSWSARNAGDGDLESGQRCRVKRIDGLTLLLVPEERN